jgi:hypothetical protein
MNNPRIKNVGLYGRMESIDFPKNLALMQKMLVELKDLSMKLHERVSTIHLVDKTIKRIIRVNE